MVNNKFWKSILVYNTFIVVGVGMLYMLYLLYTHTLSNNGRWQSSKTELEKGVMGSWSFTLTYRALAGNQLDLGTWHGYQEVFVKPPPERYRSLSVDFRLDKEATLVLFLEQRADTLVALRLSSDPKYDNAFLKVVNGAFVQKNSLKIANLASGLHHLEIRIADHLPEVVIRGEEPMTEELPEPISANILGFRGYENSVVLDNIVLRDAAGQQVFRERFNRKPVKWGLPLLMIFIANILWVLLIRARRWLLILAVNATAIFLILLIFFLVYGRYQYPKEWMIHWRSAVTTISSANEVVSSLEDAEQITDNSEQPFRILFLGSSQTWGAGASTEEETFINRFETLINKSKETPIQCFNTGISGVRSCDILELYRQQWIHLQPDLCVINLSLNDAGNVAFRSNLEAMIKLNERHGITTVLIPEPIDKEMEAHRINQNIVKSLAEEYGLLLVELQEMLHAHADRGFVFWDFVHLTDYGHYLVAQHLYNKLYVKTTSSSVNRIPSVSSSSSIGL